MLAAELKLTHEFYEFSSNMEELYTPKSLKAIGPLVSNASSFIRRMLQKERHTLS